MKKDCNGKKDAQETRMETQTQSERRKVLEELVFLTDDVTTIKMGSNRTVSSAASTGSGLGTGTHARPPPLGPRWKDTWVPRKLVFKGWVTEKPR